MTDGSDSARASADELYREAEELMGRARAKLAEARDAGHEDSSEDSWSELVDLEALLRRSLPARAEVLSMERRIRDRMFRPDLFADLAWDILLEVCVGRTEGGGLSVDAICKFASASRETIRRYVSLLEDQGLVEVSRSSTVDRCELVRLSQRGRGIMSRFFKRIDVQIRRQIARKSGVRVPDYDVR